MVITKKNMFVTVWLVVLVLAIYMLMSVSYQVKGLQSRLETINASIQNEKENIRTLNAEWSYLTDPSRIEKLSAELLPNLTIIKAQDILNLDNIKESNNIIAISDETQQENNIIKVYIGNAD